MTYVTAPKPVALGKRAAIVDPRLPTLSAVLDRRHLPTPPRWVNWRAGMPASGVPILGNDIAGNCVWATGFHFLDLLHAYTGIALPHSPTTAECLAAYGAGTGYNPSIPSTDQGTYYAGPGGFFDFWIKTGFVCGGVRNRLSAVTVLDVKNPVDIQDALSIGPVMFGAALSESDVRSPFMWDDHAGPIEGGHAFLGLGYEKLLSGKTYYDIATWDGEWRFTDTWATKALDEAYLPLNAAFFNSVGLNPAALSLAQVAAAMAIVRRGG